MRPWHGVLRLEVLAAWSHLHALMVMGGEHGQLSRGRRGKYRCRWSSSERTSIVGFWRGVYTRFWSEVLRLLRQSGLTELQTLKECTAICLGLGTAIACRSFHGPGGAYDFKGVWALTCECWSGSRTLSGKSVSPCLTCLCSPGKRIS